MTERGSRILRLVMAFILLASMFIVARRSAVYVNSINIEEKKKTCIVIDAGHGGADPGKVGAAGQLEKDINLKIAFLLKKSLEAEGIKVVMTRETDSGLYDADASNKKVQDMKRRLEIIEKADPVLVVSIHQNSYHEEYVKGAQVFYYQTGTESRKLAEYIQEELRRQDGGNKREAKGNESYYLLKKTAKTIVIVECGFLSNREEAEKLSNAVYQEKTASSIHTGVMRYLEEMRQPASDEIQQPFDSSQKKENVIE